MEKIKLTFNERDYLYDTLERILKGRIEGDIEKVLESPLSNYIEIVHENDKASSVKGAFDLKLVKNGVPICTKGGYSARIVSFDVNGSDLLVLVTINGEEKPYIYDKYGICKTNSDESLLLRMKFKKVVGWVNVHKTFEPYSTEEEAKSECINCENYRQAKIIYFE